MLLERINKSLGKDLPVGEIDTWLAGVKSLLDEMDPTGVYTQRFDIASGLTSHDEYNLTGGARHQARLLRNRLTRLAEFMQESER